MALGPARAGALALLAAAALAGWRVAHALEALETPVDRHGAPFVGSRACARCHGDHQASWEASHHRRMTQEAREGAVLGAFDGSTLAYGGYLATMDRSAEGAFQVTLRRMDDEAPSAAGVPAEPADAIASGSRSRTTPAEITRWTVERVVGSRRHQQLLAREDDLWVRLPIAWDVEEGRWMHMNGAFLTSDPEGLDGEAPIAFADYMRHAVRWNDNCVFCHNVGAEPRPRDDGHWDTRVAELGVACEACHGPGGEHARTNADPFRRYVLHETGRADPTITAPTRLSAERATDVCGRCHGQRITADVGRYLAHGDPFVPGDDLADTSHPLAIDTPLHGDASAFAPRFWPDGTARLTAYEQQGVLQDRCDAACGDCHAMHDYASPRGQLRADLEGDALCTQCHESLAGESAAQAHARHEGVACVDCHMPRIVYGIRTIHRSHRIEIPHPLAQSEGGRPDACTLCHVDRSVAWAERGIGAADERHDAGGRARMEELVFGGDPIERAVAAAALGRALGERGAPSASGWLVAAMRDDPYPAVRGIAWRSVSAARGLPASAFRSTDARAARVAALEALGLRAVTPADVDALRARADERAIEIGE